MINTYFDKIFCINLKRRTDRRKQAEDEFAKCGLQVEFIEGIDGSTLNIPRIISKDGQVVSRGDLGCTLTHLKIAELAKEKGYKRYLVLEDDVELINNVNELFSDFIIQVPNEWNMLYLGGNHMGGYKMVMPNIAKIFKTFTTHAYCVNGDITINSLIRVLGRKNEKVDVAIADLHSELNCYVMRPHLAWQRDSYSDILEKNCSYPFLKN